MRVLRLREVASGWKLGPPSGLRPCSQGKQVIRERGSSSVSFPSLPYQIETAPSLGISDSVSDRNPKREEAASYSWRLVYTFSHGNMKMRKCFPLTGDWLLSACIREVNMVVWGNVVDALGNQFHFLKNLQHLKWAFSDMPSTSVNYHSLNKSFMNKEVNVVHIYGYVWEKLPTRSLILFKTFLPTSDTGTMLGFFPLPKSTY